MGGKAKGNSYEREICGLLSEWWSSGKRDDIFWRSASSGGRATSRFRRSGKKTTGSHGDITAVCPSGNSLLRVACIEVKRGYSKTTIQDHVDLLPHQKQCEFSKWVSQAIESAEGAGALSWLIISKRNQRCSMIWTPSRLISQLKEYGAFKTPSIPTILVDAYFDKKRIVIRGMPLEEWFFAVRPKHFKALLEEHETVTK